MSIIRVCNFVIAITLLCSNAMAEFNPVKTEQRICSKGNSSLARTSIAKSIKIAAKQAGIKIAKLTIEATDISRPTKVFTSELVPVTISSNPLNLVVGTNTFDFTKTCEIIREFKITLKTKGGEVSVTKIPVTLQGIYIKVAQ